MDPIYEYGLISAMPGAVIPNWPANGLNEAIESLTREIGLLTDAKAFKEGYITISYDGELYEPLLSYDIASRQWRLTDKVCP